MFDWLSFIEQHRIDYRTGGPNVSKGHIAVHCPFCGSQDPSQHMSISLTGKGWRCWRNPEHRGKNPTRLVQTLIGCTTVRAMEIVGAVAVPNNFMEQVRQQIKPASPKAISSRPLKIPTEFKAFDTQLPSSRPYVAYLQRNRGFSDSQIRTLTKWRDVYYCTLGPYRGRIVFAIWHEGELVSWTGRTIYVAEELRYRSLSHIPERAEAEGYPPARGAISNYLLWYDDLLETDCDTLILTEGPFDALKVNVLGSARYGICATCFFTNSPSEQQIELLHTLCPRFKRCILLLDQGMFSLAIRTASRLSALGVVVEQLPPTFKDPGELVDLNFLT